MNLNLITVFRSEYIENLSYYPSMRLRHYSLSYMRHSTLFKFEFTDYIIGFYFDYWHTLHKTKIIMYIIIVPVCVRALVWVGWFVFLKLKCYLSLSHFMNIFNIKHFSGECKYHSECSAKRYKELISYHILSYINIVTRREKKCKGLASENLDN